MQQVSPSDGERFYLRILLCNLKGEDFEDGKINYENLYWFQNERSNTYQEVCLRRGYIRDNAIWRTYMEEATILMLGPQLRRTFARIRNRKFKKYPYNF